MLPARPFFYEVFMDNQVFAVAPQITKRNFLRKIYEYSEICNEMQMQEGEDRVARLEAVFGKKAMEARSLVDERVSRDRSRHIALLELDLCAEWSPSYKSIVLFARDGKGRWYDVARVGSACSGRTRYEVVSGTPALLLKRWTPATTDIISGLKRSSRRPSSVYCGTKDGWMHGPCDWYSQLCPRYIARTVSSVCQKIEQMENAPSAFKQDAIMFANEINLRTQIFGSLHRRYFETPSHTNNPFNNDIAYGGEFSAYQMNVLLQAPSDDYPSGLRVMATTPPACLKGFPEVMYFTRGVGDYEPDRPRPGMTAVDSLESFRVFARMGDALSHIMEWCASTVEIPC